MKKFIFVVALLATSVVSSWAQSNTSGTFHVGLGYGALIGGATIKDDVTSNKGVGVRANYGVRASYGICDAVSLGVYLRKEGAVYAVGSNGYNSSVSYNVTQSTVGFGIEPKFYAVNKDKFNLYIAPSIGLVAGKTYNDYGASTKYSTSGLGYGATVGFNWYWAKYIGMSLDLGYAGVSTKVKTDNGDFKVNGGGFYFGIGLVSKFGGQ